MNARIGVRIPEGQPDFAAATERAVYLHIYRNLGPLAAIRWKLFKMIGASGMDFYQVARRIHVRPGAVAKWLRDGDRSINKLDPISDLALACGCELSFKMEPRPSGVPRPK